MLPQGNQDCLPEPSGAFAWNPLAGEYGEYERLGSGTFLLNRMRWVGATACLHIIGSGASRRCRYVAQNNIASRAVMIVIHFALQAVWFCVLMAPWCAAYGGSHRP